MEGLRFTRVTRPARFVRPMALVSAVVALLAALHLCSGPVGHPSASPAHHARGGSAASAAGHAPEHARARPAAVVPAYGPAAASASGPVHGPGYGTTASGPVPAGPAAAGPATGGPAAVPVDRYSCPYDDAECDLVPPLEPAVLTATPPDPPPAGDGPVPLGPVPGAVRPDGVRPVPRAPDLHVLQVLRT
ncbi:hypothetical protein AB0E11_03460 [Streptomyces fradiae]|uniref:hypothetical protein n=1 Tax=Streptomyces fradiae TaxID=1906 RepID=UPI0033E21F9D